MLLSIAICQPKISNSEDYKLQVKWVDSSIFTNATSLGIKTSFSNGQACAVYTRQLPSYLQTKGFLAASADTITFDTAQAIVHLYLGMQQKLTQLQVDSVEKKALDESGFVEKLVINKPVDFVGLELLKEKLLRFYERNGYPFAGVYLDNLHFDSANVIAALKVKKGPLYLLDSIRMYGKVKSQLKN